MSETVGTTGAGYTRRALTGIGILIALVLAWRAVVIGMVALDEGGAPGTPTGAAGGEVSDATWRARLAQNPADYVSLVMLARELERQGKPTDARAAMAEAVRLAPANRQVLLEAAALRLRAGDEAQALALLRRVVDLYPGARGDIWPVYVSALNSGRHDAFFAAAAREDPDWWPQFFAAACDKAANVETIERLFTVRAAAGAAADDERRCLIGRLQRENRWVNAYQAWLNSLPPAQRQRVGYVFNGDFELPLSNLGFDWTMPQQDGVIVEALPAAGATGKRALRVDFVNKRWTGAPVKQYLMLGPGRYRFEGRGRADRLDTWLGVQWGLYCLPQPGTEPRQLTRSERLRGASDWEVFAYEFVVPANCAVQVLQLELANPRADAGAPGDVAARLRGAVWYDDFRVRSLD